MSEVLTGKWDMTITIRMKRLSRETQLATISHSEILSPIEELVAKLTGLEVSGYRGTKLSYGQILNGLLLQLLDHSEDYQIELAKEAIARLQLWSLGVQPTSADGIKGNPLKVLPPFQRKENGTKKR